MKEMASPRNAVDACRGRFAPPLPDGHQWPPRTPVDPWGGCFGRMHNGTGAGDQYIGGIGITCGVAPSVVEYSTGVASGVGEEPIVLASARAVIFAPRHYCMTQDGQL